MSTLTRQASHTRVELRCKVCPAKHFVSSGSFVTHLSTVHCGVEGGSYTCKYGENGICSACPAVGISQSDYQSHVSWYHLQPSPPLANSSSRMSFSLGNDCWSVLSSTVNLPAVLNDPGKGKQRDFFTRSWGVDFIDCSTVSSSPHVCELPPNAFDRYLRKLRKYYSRHKKTVARPHQPGASPGQFSNGSPSSVSSRETTPSPLPVTPPASPVKPQPKLDIPRIFLEQNFDLSNPDTFNRVFPFMKESLSQTDRSNPFQIEPKQIKQVETSGKLIQEQLSHYLDQVEVSIAGQVASKSHHFFQVMTYHDALMSQLVALISLVKSLRLRLADVEVGVVSALRVPLLLRRRENLARITEMVRTISDVHQTQPTIQSLLSVQEFAGALDLISTSQDILDDHVGDVLALRYLPNQLTELHDVIGRMLISDFQDIVSTDLSRPVKRTRASGHAEEAAGHVEGAISHAGDEEVCEIDECALSSVVTGLIRQHSFTFLELLEEEGVSAVKRVIKEIVLSILDLTEEKTLTSLVAEFANRATPEGWSDLLDYLIGSLLTVLARVSVIHQVILSCIQQSEEPLEQLEDNQTNCDMEKIVNGVGKINVKDNPFLNGDVDDLDASRDSEDSKVGRTSLNNSGLESIKAGRLASSLREVMINICDQVHERMGKLVTVRSRPAAVKLVTPVELATVQDLISKLTQTTSDICGKQCQGLQLSHQGQTILYIQWFHDAAMSRIATMLETEKWKKSSSSEPLSDLHNAVSSATDSSRSSSSSSVNTICDNLSMVDSVPVFLTLLSDYCHLADQLPLATQEIGLKTADLLKLFNSRTCQLVLGAGAVSTAGLKTITIRNLAITLRSLDLVAKTIQCVRAHFLAVCPSLTEKQMNALTRNFDHAARDFQDHLSELKRKIVEVVDAALQQQLSTWQRKPPVPSASFKSIGKQLTKLLESIQDVMPSDQVNQLFKTIHLQFLSRVSDRLRAAGLKADNSPTHGLVVSELIFYRENLKYMNVLEPKDLEDSSLQRVWQR